MIDEIEVNLKPRVWVEAGIGKETEVFPIIRSFELLRYGILNVKAEK